MQVDKLEAVSDSELVDDTQEDDPHPDEDKPQDLENIDSDEDEFDAKSAAGHSETVGGSATVCFRFCRHCRLIFADAESLKSHEESDNHGKVVAGSKPSQSSFDCVVCWLGFEV